MKDEFIELHELRLCYPKIREIRLIRKN